MMLSESLKYFSQTFQGLTSLVSSSLIIYEMGVECWSIKFQKNSMVSSPVCWQGYKSHRPLKCRKIHQKNTIRQEDLEAHLIHPCTVPAIQLCKKGLYKSYQSKDSVSWIDLEFLASSSYLFLFGKLIVVLDNIHTKKLYTWEL